MSHEAATLTSGEMPCREFNHRLENLTGVGRSNLSLSA